MKNLVIIGAGGFGRELFSAALESLGHGTDFTVKGFLDDNPSALDGYANYPAILGSPQTYAIQPNDVFITAIGNPATRRRLAEALEARGAAFISLVHRSAWLGRNVTVGAGSFIAHNVVLTVDIAVGRHACVFHGTEIGHDSTVGDFAHVYSLCSIGGGVHIGDGAVVYPGARIVPRRTIGADAIVGIGSAVLLNVRPGTAVFGVPAKEVPPSLR